MRRACTIPARTRARSARTSAGRRPGLEPLESRALLSAGDLDRTFGEPIPPVKPPIDPFQARSRGFIRTDFGGADDATAIALQPDGKIVVVGSSRLMGRMAVARYNYDGTPDYGFGILGRREITPFPAFDYRPYQSIARGVVVQGDGKILVVGSTRLNDPANPVAYYDVAIARLLPDGSTDLNFGSLGYSIVSVGAQDDFARAVALQADGKIVIAGDAQLDYGNQDAFVLRLNADGQRDAGFGTSGVVRLDVGTHDEVASLALQPDGKPVIVGRTAAPGRTKYDILTARFTTSGSLDTNWSTGFGSLVRRMGPRRVGYVLTSLSEGLYPDSGTGVAVQPDGKIVVAGNDAQGTGVVLRMTTTGGLDSTFSGDGKASLDSSLSLHGVALQGDGRIVVVGAYQVDQPSDAALQRLNADGSIDGAFQMVHPSLARGYPDPRGVTAHALAIQPNGRIVIAGTSQSTLDPLDSDFILARYLDGRVLQGNYGDQAGADPAVFHRKTGAWSVAWVVGEPAIDSMLPTLGSSDFDSALPIAADFDGDGLTDQALFRPASGQWEVHLRVGQGFTYVFGAGTSGVPVAADFDGDGKADLAIFNPATAAWTIRNSSTRAVATKKIPGLRGSAKLIPVPADYDGDGKADLAVFNSASADWIIRKSSNGVRISRHVAEFTPNLAWIPVAGDFNGDGKAELAAFRPGTARWRGYAIDGTTLVFNATFGQRRWRDIPLAAAFGSLKKLGKI
ncbi:MAG: FG-GAP-like repeat-containing protein [Isosphaeraceae bacterium]